jgi:predicted metal-dependent hydrolase
LLELDPEVWSYGIVHELLYFDVPNHGKLWKSLMRAYVGDWELYEELLRLHAEKNRIN